MISTKLTLVAVGLGALLLVAGTAAAIPSQAAGQAQPHNGADDHPTGGLQQADDSDATDEEADSGDDTEEATGNETDDEPSPDQDRERTRNHTRAQDRRMATVSGEAQGPPVDMPTQVPDHVTQIHETIRSFLAGDLDGSLGRAIAGFMPAHGGHGNGPSSSGPPAGAGH